MTPPDDSRDRMNRAERSLDDLGADMADLRVDVAEIKTSFQAHERLDAERHTETKEALADLRRSVEGIPAKLIAARAEEAKVAAELSRERLKLAGQVTAGLFALATTIAGLWWGRDEIAQVLEQPAAVVAPAREERDGGGAGAGLPPL